MHPRSPLGGAALLLFFFLLPTSMAAAPRGVDALVAESISVAYQAAPPSFFDSKLNLTWRLSPDDPDQSVGAFNYTLYDNRTLSATGWFPTYNLSRTPVPGRPGWVYNGNLQIASTATDSSYVIGYNMTVQDVFSASPNVSAPSCLLTFEAAQPGAHTQCGWTIEPPRGVSALVDSLVRLESSQVTDTTFRWRLSVNDTDQTNGSFDYWFFYGLSPETMFRNDETQSVDTPGVRRLTMETSKAAGEAFHEYARFVARDPMTHQRSAYSCTVQVLGGAIYRASTCGDIQVPSGGFVGDGPTFPLINVPEAADTLDLPESVLAGILAAILVFGFISLGWLFAEVVGATVGGVGSVGLAAELGLIPIYTLIVAFLLAMVIIVAYFRRGGEAA